MGISRGPKLDNNGLFLFLDPANEKCFVPGEDTCVNLISKKSVTGANGNPNTGTHTPIASNFPEYNSINGGVFDFAGGKGMNFEEDLGPHTEMTLIMWNYKSSVNQEYLSDGRNGGGQWFLTNYLNNNITFTNVLTYNYSGTYVATDGINEWRLITVTSSNSSGSSVLYLNGTQVATGNSIDEDFGVNFRIGTRYTLQNNWSGYMGVIMAYNRVLSPTEVTENFNLYRKRYGV